MTILVHSDVLIEVMRGRNQEIIQRWRALGNSDARVLCSAVSIAELWHGALPPEHRALVALFDSIGCVPVDAAIGRRAGEFLRLFHKSHNLELGDAIIGATAELSAAQLWTRNQEHYPMKSLKFY